MTVRLTTDNPTGPCNQYLMIEVIIDEAVYVVNRPGSHPYSLRREMMQILHQQSQELRAELQVPGA